MSNFENFDPDLGDGLDFYDQGFGNELYDNGFREYRDPYDDGEPKPQPGPMSEYLQQYESDELADSAARRYARLSEKMTEEDKAKAKRLADRKLRKRDGTILVDTPQLRIGQICRVFPPDGIKPILGRNLKVVILNDTDAFGLVKVAQIHTWENCEIPIDLVYLSRDSHVGIWVESYNIYGIQLAWLKPTPFRVDIDLATCEKKYCKRHRRSEHLQFMKHEIEIGSRFSLPSVLAAID